MNETLPVGDELDKLVDYIFDMIEDPLYLKVSRKNFKICVMNYNFFKF